MKNAQEVETRKRKRKKIKRIKTRRAPAQAEKKAMIKRTMMRKAQGVGVEAVQVLTIVPKTLRTARRRRKKSQNFPLHQSTNP